MVRIMSNREEAVKMKEISATEADEFVELGDEIRIILLGKTGSGKSETGNTILGKDGKFKALSSAKSVTVQCKRGCSERFKKDIHVVDTPGLFDTSFSNKDVQAEIKKCIHITAPGPHAFIYVLGLTRFTMEEYDSVTHFVKHFGEKIYDYFIILFTRRDDLECENKSIEDHLQTIPDNLKEIVKKCGGRCLAFNNRARGLSQERQVKSLLKMIQTNIMKNGQIYYSDFMYEEATKVMKERVEQYKIEMEEKQQRKLIEYREKIDEGWKRILDKYQEMAQRKEKEVNELKMRMKESEMYFRNALEKQRMEAKDREDQIYRENEREMHYLREKLNEMASKWDSLRRKLDSGD